ncbi:MAG: VOC family protein [Planctomycetota bacterium]
MPGGLAFHVAFPVLDLASTRAFYGGLLGCREGRSAEDWVDFDFFGHQISAHLMPEACRASEAHDVDGDDVPVRHFGLVLEWKAWHALRDRLVKSGVGFRIEPHLRFEGGPGEQATMFLVDPSGNALEFKAFQDPARLFAKY